MNFTFSNISLTSFFLFLTLFILPQTLLAFSYSSEPCGATKDDCPAGPVAGLTLNKATDDKHLYHDEGSKNVTCKYGDGLKYVELKFSCTRDEATAKLESQYSNNEKKRPLPEGSSEFSQKMNNQRVKGPCEIPSSATDKEGWSNQKCRGYTYAGKYYVYALGSYPWKSKSPDAKETAPVAEAKAMEIVESALQSAKNFNPKEISKNGLKGRAYSLDILKLEEPIPYAQLTLSLDGKEYKTVANENGEYSFNLGSDISEKNGTLTLTLMGEIDGKEFFEVVDASVNTEPVEVSRKIHIENKNDSDFVINVVLSKDYESESDRNKVRGLTNKYNELYQAIDYAERVLQIDVSKLRGEDMLPISLYAYDEEANTLNSSFYSSDYGVIRLDNQDSKYYSPNKSLTIFHEFGHHIMHTFYPPVEWDSSLDVEGNINHGGIFNTNTADSLGEGYATFIALLIAQEHGYTYPHPYSPSPIAFERNWEVNFQAWDMEGSVSREEFAVVTLLYDLIDKHKDTGDDIKMSINSLIEVMKDEKVQTVKALYDKLITIEDKTKIDALFVAHGFFWDKQEGDGQWSTGGTFTNPNTWDTCTTTADEPYQDTNNDGVFDTTVDRWMDYSNWNDYPCVPTFDEGDEVGYTGSYQTDARKTYVNLSNRFMEVNNGTYIQNFTFPDNPEYDYTLTYEVTDNMLPVTFPPARYNASVEIQETEGDTIVITTDEYKTAIKETAEKDTFKSIRTEKDTSKILYGLIIVVLVVGGAFLVFRKRGNRA